MECAPAFDYGREAPRRRELGEHGARLHARRAVAVASNSPIPLHRGEHGVFADFALSAGESGDVRPRARRLAAITGDRSIEPEATAAAFEETRRLLAALARDARPTVGAGARWSHRSALTLKLLTYAPTGAIVAAPTARLPEGIGGERNWDYRYTWIRDAAFTLYALLRLGFTEEAAAFMDWLEARAKERARPTNGPLQIMYGIDGRHDLARARRSTHLEGYRGSRPVRIGNAAVEQLQLDIYGELLDSVYLYNKYGLRRSPTTSGASCAGSSTGSPRHWQRARRGHLGGARRAPAVRLLAADELGRVRPRRCASRAAARPARRRRRAGRRRAT